MSKLLAKGVLGWAVHTCSVYHKLYDVILAVHFNFL